MFSLEQNTNAREMRRINTRESQKNRRRAENLPKDGKSPHMLSVSRKIPVCNGNIPIFIKIDARLHGFIKRDKAEKEDAPVGDIDPRITI